MRVDVETVGLSAVDGLFTTDLHVVDVRDDRCGTRIVPPLRVVAALKDRGERRVRVDVPGGRSSDAVLLAIGLFAIVGDRRAFERTAAVHLGGTSRTGRGHRRGRGRPRELDVV